MTQTLAQYLQSTDPSAARYEIRSQLGEGAMGVVLLGYDTKLHREVAIKVLLLDDEAQAQSRRERMYREAHAVAALSHPNIIAIYDYSGPDEPRAYLVMERLRGKSLEEIVDNNGTLPESRTVEIGIAVGRALAQAHAQGLVHRDVKPGNIHIEPDGRVVLLDFGIVKGSTSDRDTFVGGATQLMGTPMFASPEQLLGSSAITPASDVYALGATLYFLVSQKHPHEATKLMDLVKKLQKSESQPLDAPVSDAFKAVIMKALKRRPEERWENCAEMVRALESLQKRLPNNSTIEVSRSVPRRSQAPMQIATTVALIALSGATWSLAVKRPQAASVPPPAEQKAATAVVEQPPLPPPVVEAAVIKEDVVVRVQVSPWGRVTVDGKLRGVTPALRQLTLSPTLHEIVVTNPAIGEKKLTIDYANPSAPRELTIDLE